MIFVSLHLFFKPLFWPLAPPPSGCNAAANINARTARGQSAAKRRGHTESGHREWREQGGRRCARSHGDSHRREQQQFCRRRRDGGAARRDGGAASEAAPAEASRRLVVYERRHRQGGGRACWALQQCRERRHLHAPAGERSTTHATVFRKHTSDAHAHKFTTYFREDLGCTSADVTLFGNLAQAALGMFIIPAGMLHRHVSSSSSKRTGDAAVAAFTGGSQSLGLYVRRTHARTHTSPALHSLTRRSRALFLHPFMFPSSALAHRHCVASQAGRRHQPRDDGRAHLHWLRVLRRGNSFNVWTHHVGDWGELCASPRPQARLHREFPPCPCSHHARPLSPSSTGRDD